MWWRITDEHIKYRESDNIRDRNLTGARKLGATSDEQK
jgi:hypothetical protein